MADASQIEKRPRTTPGRRLMALVKAVVPTVLVFLIVGPVVGYFAIMLPFAIGTGEGAAGMLENLLAALTVLPLGAAFAYMLGYLPALVTGFVVALADCLTDLGSYRTPAAIVAGGAITIFMTAVARDTEPLGGTYDGFLMGAGAVGAIAAGVCAMIAPRRVPSQPAA